MEYPCIDCPDKYYCDKLCVQAEIYKRQMESQLFADENSITKIVKIKVGDSHYQRTVRKKNTVNTEFSFRAGNFRSSN